MIEYRSYHEQIPKHCICEHEALDCSRFAVVGEFSWWSAGTIVTTCPPDTSGNCSSLSIRLVLLWTSRERLKQHKQLPAADHANAPRCAFTIFSSSIWILIVSSTKTSSSVRPWLQHNSQTHDEATRILSICELSVMLCKTVLNSRTESNDARVATIVMVGSWSCTSCSSSASRTWITCSLGCFQCSGDCSLKQSFDHGDSHPHVSN